jgi:hypothetical protein
MVQTAKQRGWIPIAVSYPNYLRLDSRLSVKKESWDKVITRCLDQLEAYEKKYGKLPEV